MSREQDNNSGALFRNRKKETDRQPDYTGTATVDNIQYRISAWINEPRGGGDKYFSIKFTPADDVMTKRDTKRSNDDDGMTSSTPVDKGKAANGGTSAFTPSSQTRQEPNELDDDLPF